MYPEAACVSRDRFCFHFFAAVCSGEVDPLLAYVTGKAWACLNGYRNTQNDKYRAKQIPD